MGTELFDYGKWILGSGIIVFLINQGDDAFVGWFLGASALGFYQIAYRFSNAPATEVTHIISRVIFPTYSKIQSDSEKLREAFFTTVQLTTLISFPMAAGIIIVAPPFTRGFLGDQWIPAITVMQILALWGGLRSLGATTGPLFQAVGRPDYATKIQFGKLVIIAILIYPLTARYGFAGTALVIVGNSLFFSEPLASYVAIKTVGGSYQRFFKYLIYPLIGSCIMIVTIWMTRIIIDVHSDILEFFLLVPLGILVYLIVMLMIDEISEYHMKVILKKTVDNVG
jgi:PST family polysaccharide transporter/lipopolysaccharide exporter